MPVIGITGRRRSGKDTVANILVEHYGYVKIELPAPLTEELCILDPWCHVDVEWQDLSEWMRFSDLVARVGIDEAKNASPDVRSYQQRYGTDIVRDRIDVNRWVTLADDRIWRLQQQGQRNFVLPNIRAENERVMCELIIGVTREDHEPTTGDHKIEHDIDRLVDECDWPIFNPNHANWRASLVEQVSDLLVLEGQV